jgi:hypothetical protein
MAVVYPSITSGELNKSNPKKWTLKPTSRDVAVFSPGDGVVTNVDQRKGSVRIKHNIGGQTFFGKYSNIDTISVNVGEKVSYASTIGYTKELNYELLDNYGLEQIINPFFIGTAIGGSFLIDTKKTTTDKQTQQQKVEKGKEDKVSIKKDSEEKKSNLPKDKGGEYKYDPGDLSFLDIGLLPLHLVNAGWGMLKNKWKKDEEKKKAEELTEEIQRFKKLMK